MPVSIKKLKGGGYQVRTPNRIHSKHTSLANAQAQKRIIDAADAGHPIVKKKRRASLKSLFG